MNLTLTGWSYTGDLSTLDRFSAYGVFSPNVNIGNIAVGPPEAEFVWDFESIAVRPVGLRLETSGVFSVVSQTSGSNDGENWTTLSLSLDDFENDADGISSRLFSVTTDKFYRYLKVTYWEGTTATNLRIHAYQWQYDASRPWSESGDGGVGPGGGGTGGGANDPGGENDPSTHEGFEMSDLAVYAGDMVLGWIKGSDMASAPSEVWAALYNGDPEESGEEFDASYGMTRAQVTFGSIVARYMLNTNTLNFGTPNDDISITAYALFDAEEDGNMLTRKILSAPVAITNGTPVVVRPGKLPVYY